MLHFACEPLAFHNSIAPLKGFGCFVKSGLAKEESDMGGLWLNVQVTSASSGLSGSESYRQSMAFLGRKGAEREKGTWER